MQIHIVQGNDPNKPVSWGHISYLTVFKDDAGNRYLKLDSRALRWTCLE